MKVLVDTNILLRSIQKQHPACRVARRALVSLYRGRNELFLTPQNLAEFWNVCTRPTDANGLGLSIEETDDYTKQIEKFFVVLPESVAVFEEWRRIVVEFSVKGVKVHDARLAAAMKVYSMENILTFNAPDFARFTFIKALRPDRL